MLSEKNKDKKEKDLELLQVKGKKEIDPTNPEFAYLFPRFDASVEGNERDYVEAHIFDTNENFLESAVVNREYIDKDINLDMAKKIVELFKKKQNRFI